MTADVCHCQHPRSQHESHLITRDQWKLLPVKTVASLGSLVLGPCPGRHYVDSMEALLAHCHPYHVGSCVSFSPAMAYHLLLISNVNNRYQIWRQLLQLRLPAGQRVKDAMLTVMTALPRLSEDYINRHSATARAALCQHPVAQQLQAMFNTPLPWYSAEAVVVMPCMNSHTQHPVNVSIDSQLPHAHLTDDCLRLVLNQLDLLTLGKALQVCSRWYQLSGTVWSGLRRVFLANRHMDTRKDFVEATGCTRLSEYQKFMRTLFVWLAKNMDAVPLGRHQSARLLRAIRDQGLVPRCLMTQATADILDFGRPLVPRRR